MSKNKDIVDLMSENLMFEEREQTIKLLKFNKSTMKLDIAIFEKGEFIKNSKMVFAHLPKKFKAKLNPKSKL